MLAFAAEVPVDLHADLHAREVDACVADGRHDRDADLAALDPRQCSAPLVLWRATGEGRSLEQRGEHRHDSQAVGEDEDSLLRMQPTDDISNGRHLLWRQRRSQARERGRRRRPPRRPLRETDLLEHHAADEAGVLELLPSCGTGHAVSTSCVGSGAVARTLLVHDGADDALYVPFLVVASGERRCCAHFERSAVAAAAQPLREKERERTRHHALHLVRHHRRPRVAQPVGQIHAALDAPLPTGMRLCASRFLRIAIGEEAVRRDADNRPKWAVSAAPGWVRVDAVARLAAHHRDVAREQSGHFQKLVTKLPSEELAVAED